MCGISGCITAVNNSGRPYLLDAILKSQFRRGPDHTDAISYPIPGSDDAVWLGHNRLSIIDLSDDGNQPMSSEDGRYSLVFNGAIYNYVEIRAELENQGRVIKSASDTEVLLQAFAQWGTNAFARFIGMFAVAILDRTEQTLTLVRDRFGVKPIYVVQQGKELAFASTSGAIAQNLKLDANMEYVGRGIRQKYYEDEAGIAPHQNMQAVPAGHFATIALGDPQIRFQPYYNVADTAALRRKDLTSVSLDVAKDELRGLLKSATELRLRADVPIGISLSGGIDSTSIAALCSTSGVDLKAFSFADPQDPQSEAALVKDLAGKYNLDVEYVHINGAEALRALFFKTLRAQQAPFPHTSQMAQYAVFEAAKAQGIKVMLGGQGGDEAFMGYRKFFLFHAMHVWQQRQWSDVPALAANIAQIAPAISKRASVFLKESKRYFGKASGLPSELTFPELVATPSPGAGKGGPAWDRQELDITRYSLPTLLRYEDRNSMANSIESRLPFLDHRIIEFGLALPTRLKLSRGMGKYVLRKAMDGLVPDSILYNRDKRGFDTRHSDFIYGGLGATIRAALSQHQQAVVQWLPEGATIDTYFADQAIVSHASRFAEATTLIWLADPSLDSYPS